MRRSSGALAEVRLGASVALAIAVLAATGCRGNAGKDPRLTITRRLTGDPRTLNPLLATSEVELAVLALVTRNLIDYDARLNLVPGLAESIESDAAHLVYTIKLRPKANWEDGTPVTADDIVYTLRALVDPAVPALNRRAFFEGFEKVERVDAKTTRVTFRVASASRMEAFNMPLLPAALYQGTPLMENPRNRQPLSNGPFRFARWDSGKSIELVRNTQYEGPPPAAERIVLRVVPDNPAAFEALVAGELDECRLTSENKARLDALGDKTSVKQYFFDELSYSYIAWNNRLPMFSDRRVRQALTMLIDRPAIIRNLFGGLAKPANGPLPAGHWAHDPSIAPWPFDPAAAEARLEEAGFRRDKGGVRKRGDVRLAFKLSLGAGSDVQRQMAEIIQQAYGKAGIEVTIDSMEWAAFSTRMDTGDFEAAILAMALDPNPDMAPSWHSSQKPPNGFNVAFYANPEADRILGELRGEFDRARFKALLGQLQRVIHEDEPVTFLLNVLAKWGIHRRIENVETSPYGLFLFWPGAAGWSPARAHAPV